MLYGWGMKRIQLRVERVPILPDATQTFARARLVVGYGSVESDGTQLLSPDCRTKREAFECIDQLMRELQAAKRQVAASSLR